MLELAKVLDVTPSELMAWDSGVIGLRTILTLAAFMLATVGCGSEDPGEPPSDPEPASYRAQVADCVEEVGFVTRNAGAALRVESPGGRLIANVQTFPSRGEAARFNADVEVPHAGGGRGVAVWLRDADDTERRVVADCLTP
jgi:hypothetical protein